MKSKDEAIVTLMAIAAKARGWRIFIVGGWIRDQLLGVRSKDVDIEVFGDFTEQELIEFCNKFGKVGPAVGKSFKALKLYHQKGKHPIDVLQAREDIKTGEGHRGFETRRITGVTEEDFKRAAERRDYTFNALMYDPLTEEVYDFFGGKKDLMNHRLCHVSEHFMDDPLRVLRGMQKSARFDLIAEMKTVAGCRSCVGDYHQLPIERVWDEWYKFFKADHPSRGLVFLNRSGWIKHYPILGLMRRLPQSPEHHPEGTVWQHMKRTVDAVPGIAKREGLTREERVVLQAAAMLHDGGKFDTQEVVEGKIQTRKHAIFGADAARVFLESIGAPKYVVQQVPELVREHMFGFGDYSTKAVRRLAARMKYTSIRMLALLMEADSRGRFTVSERRLAKIRKLVEVAASLEVKETGPVRILTGKHLVAMGYEPGQMFGVVLRAAYEAQLDGEITTVEEAKEIAERMFFFEAVDFGA